MIDEEVRNLIDKAYEKTKALLVEKRVQVEKLAEALLEREVLFQSDVELLIGKRPFEEKKVIHVVDDEVKPAEKTPDPAEINNKLQNVESNSSTQHP
jgi:cell division protease FtsH